MHRYDDDRLLGAIRKGTTVNWIRIIVASLVAEVLGIVALLAIFPVVISGGISTLGTVELQLQSHALWVGPLAGSVLCLIGGWWAGRKSRNRLAHGIRVGVLAAVIELVLLVVAGAPVGQFMLTSIGGRLLGGYAGGKVFSGIHRAPAIPTNYTQSPDH
jgi:hypothetical protein